MMLHNAALSFGAACTLWLCCPCCPFAGVWKWLDGSAWAYTKWSPNEPNNFGDRDEDYLYMWLASDAWGIGGQWNDGGADDDYQNHICMCSRRGGQQLLCRFTCMLPMLMKMLMKMMI